MKKSLIKSILTGASCGLAANQAACFLVSKALRLGYYAACPAWLPEKVGGEMNAVLLQMALFALNGILVSFLVFNKQNIVQVIGQIVWLKGRPQGEKSRLDRCSADQAIAPPS